MQAAQPPLTRRSGSEVVEHIANFNAAGLASQGREDVRDSLFLAGLVLRGGGEEHRVRVRNLSAGGMMAECDADFSKGDAVEVILRGVGRVTGKVAWRTADRIGVAFDLEIDPLAARRPVGQGADLPEFVKPAGDARRPGLRNR
ncbi:PilZ domain-containing protein [Sphingomonas sp. LaA6.9]|uniref:PilZ domain-containing protein n=1 Tax=Sphingomonas sp. LaA6.9 TaxID=2919914 RepID=UPI001F4FA6F3|nr:PilZ domain-containing protein [Sphingomonas sp. LaA6.9]MCJ8157805.1 PilZ domain-containing protein [Sphingomonas sp. LaA6.9]